MSNSAEDELVGPRHLLAIANRIFGPGSKFQVKSSPAEALLKMLVEWLECGEKGGIVWAESRTGKTFAILWAIQSLSALLGNVPFLFVPVRTHSESQTYESPTQFFRFLLKCARHPDANEGRGADTVRNRFTSWLVASANRSPINTVIMAIDEAQDLNHLQLKWLQNAANETEAEGGNLFIILVGQPALVELRDSKVAIGAEHFVGRYMSDDYQLPGLKSEDELRLFLAEFNSAKFPDADGTRIPELFLKPELANRFDLQDAAPQFWALFDAVSKADGQQDTIEIGLAYVCRAMLRFLLSASKLNAQVLEIPTTLIVDAVKRSGYDRSLRMRRINKMRDAQKEERAR